MPKIVAVAVVREDPPSVFIAEDMETLNWVLAVRLVARTSPATLGDALATALRQALLEERWADAVYDWMDAMSVEVDIYSSEDMFTTTDVEMAPTELQFTPLFRDEHDSG
jgi:hypothetical protein